MLSNMAIPVDATSKPRVIKRIVKIVSLLEDHKDALGRILLQVPIAQEISLHWNPPVHAGIVRYVAAQCRISDLRKVVRFRVSGEKNPPLPRLWEEEIQLIFGLSGRCSWYSCR
jgi:hypothetical protein